MGAQWLSGRVLDSRQRGRGVRASPASLRCGYLARHIYPSLVLVQPRKTRPLLTERLLMNVTNQIKHKKKQEGACDECIARVSRNMLEVRLQRSQLLSYKRLSFRYQSVSPTVTPNKAHSICKNSFYMGMFVFLPF